MKIPPRQVSQFIDNPPFEIANLLLYGPNEGLIRELSKRVRTSIVKDLSDPFLSNELTDFNLKEQPGLLVDLAFEYSLLGQRKVIRVSNVGDTFSSIFEELIKKIGAAETSLVVVEAGDLGPRSKLRKLFEESETSAAIACYQDEDGNILALANKLFRISGIEVETDAINWLVDRLGGDRAIISSEIEKICLYASDKGNVNIDQMRTLIGDSSSILLEKLCMDVAGGNIFSVNRSLNKIFSHDVHAIQILRSVSRHFSRLDLALFHMKKGKSLSAAAQALKPPVFFKYKDEFIRQLNFWTNDEVGNILLMLHEAEKACKRTGAPQEALCSRALISATSTAVSRSKNISK
tara:strand:+ start:89724 stop:90770 length:1047 start_codon:yes stop_codon:yes gene_type:complete